MFDLRGTRDGPCHDIVPPRHRSTTPSGARTTGHVPLIRAENPPEQPKETRS